MKKIFVITALMLAAATFSAAQKLETGKTFEREIGGAEKHGYDIQLRKDEAYSLVVEQRGADVVLRAYAPDGSLAADIDTPNGTKGDEAMLFVALTSGNYRIEISPLDADAPKGKYFVKTAATRAATKAERNDAQLKNDLLAVVRALDDAANRGDKTAGQRMIADDYITTSIEGRTSYKADTMTGLPEPKDAEKVKINSNYSNVQVRDYGDTALLSFIDSTAIQIGGQTVDSKMRVTQIFRRINGQWQLAAGHATEIKKAQNPPIVKLDAKVLNEYAGQYEIAPGVILNVQSDGEKLLLYTKDASNKNEWYPMGENTFFYRGGTRRTIFVRDASGKVIEAINRSEDGQELKAKKIK